MSPKSWCRSVLAAAVTVALSGSVGHAVDLYVDNAAGHDRFDGRFALPTGRVEGPVRTIRRALFLARPGDRILLADTGAPYYESLSLTGARHDGFSEAPLTIVGNGATLSGARMLPPEAWRYRGGDLWTFTPFRKGYYLLLLEGKPVPEIVAPTDAPAMPELPVGHWCAWRGAIHYRSDEAEDPRWRPFAFADDGVGISLYDVRHVVIEELVLEHFRQDGIHVHDRCEDVSLFGVTCRENGRAGVAVSGTSAVRIVGGTFAGNRKHDVLLRGEAGAAIDESELEKPPVVID